MTALFHSLTKKEIERKLLELRDVPVTEDDQDGALRPIYDLLMSAKPASDGRYHWFCDLADSVTVEAARYLLRLFAYTDEKVVKWQERLAECLRGCVGCVAGLNEARRTAKSTYFGAFPEHTMTRFWSVVDIWEVKRISESLKFTGISSEKANWLQNTPQPVLYHILSRAAALQDEFILSVISCDVKPPSRDFQWLKGPCLPGIFLLLNHKSQTVRTWARATLEKADLFTEDRFTVDHEASLCAVLKVLTEKDVQGNAGPISVNQAAISLRKNFPFSQSLEDLWMGLSFIIRLLPATVLTRLNIPHIVFGHVHDTGKEFAGILHSLFCVVSKLRKNLWQGEKADYPTVIFDAIKDNPAYQDLVLTFNYKAKPWHLMNFLDYLRSVWDMSCFDDVLAKLVALCIEDLQHERFEKVRHFVMSCAVEMLRSVQQKVAREKAVKQFEALTHVVGVHCDIIIAVAFSKHYSGDEWLQSRRVALDLMRVLLSIDIDNLLFSVKQLTVVKPTTKADEIRAILPPIQEKLWLLMNRNISIGNLDAVVSLIYLVSRSSKLDNLSKDLLQSRVGSGQRVVPSETLVAAKTFVREFNSALSLTREKLLPIIDRFATDSSPQRLHELLNREGVIRDLIYLIFSPVEDLREAAQRLVGQAFDADVRIECFRQLLDKKPEETFPALISYLEDFCAYSVQVLEACGVSKALVRSLTDILEVLGCPPYGLLLHESFIKSCKSKKVDLSKVLPVLWQSMAKAIAIIFRRTPDWATYFDNNVMLEWMRDALIFARDLVGYRRTVEKAVLAATGSDSLKSSPVKLSPIGKRMVDDLQDVLRQLQKWLRLTDEELLHQSFELLKSLLDSFNNVKVKPSDETLDRLATFVEQNRSKSSGGSKSQPSYTLLDPGRLSQLQIAISQFFEDDDDEVQLLSYKPAAKQSIELISQSLSKPSTSASIKSSKADKKRLKQSTLKFSPSSLDRDADKAEKSFARAQKGSSGSSTQIKFEGSYNRPTKARTPPSESSSSSSSYESSSEEEEVKRTVTPVKTKVRVQPFARPPGERRQIKIIDDPATTGVNPIMRRIQQRQDAIRTSQRLKPDVTLLYKAILSWPYDPENGSPNYPGKPGTKLPDRFNNSSDYYYSFEPLLLQECWSQLCKSQDEESEVFQCKVESRQFVDSYLDIGLVLVSTVRKDWRLSETDIVVLKTLPSMKCILAKVLRFKSNMFGYQIDMRCLPSKEAPDPGLTVGSIAQGNVIFSLSTVVREYGALVGLPCYELSNSIYSGKLHQPPTVNPKEIERTMECYSVNEPQAEAIVASMKTEGFSLIQGPPGTGKTATICGLAGAFLSARKGPATLIVVGRQSGPAERLPCKKLLICAPSNAAIDEVTKRLIQGIRDSSGKLWHPNVVRLGSEKAISSSAKEVSMDALIDDRLMLQGLGSKEQMEISKEMTALKSELDSVKELRLAKETEMASIHDNSAKVLALDKEVKALVDKRYHLSRKLDQLRDRHKAQGRTVEASRRKIQQDILAEADIVCATLSASGHEILDAIEFEFVIIDEAAQAIELSSLIPLKYNCRKCIMVGDPQQLPPTVISREAQNMGYDRSLFVRLMKHNPNAVHLLRIQYRMHPVISQLPSHVFYGGRLSDGPDMANKTAQVWHNDSKFGVYRFFSVNRGKEEVNIVGHSLYNREECRIIVALYDRLVRQFPSIDFNRRIGIVSMYRAQVSEIKKSFLARFGKEIFDKVDFNTVDGFQGQEKDIIILSCVRGGPNVSAVGFLADERRMNVAITRSRSSLFIVGNGPTLLRSNETWKKIIEDAQSRSCFVELNDTSFFTAASTAVSVPRDKIAKSASDAGGKSANGKLSSKEKSRSSTGTKSSKNATDNDLPIPSSGISEKSNGEASTSGQAIVTARMGNTISDSNPELSTKKRRNEENHVKRPKSSEGKSLASVEAMALEAESHAIQVKPSGSSSRVSKEEDVQKRKSLDDHPPRPPPALRKDDLEVQKALRAFAKRKKDAGKNPFITRK